MDGQIDIWLDRERERDGWADRQIYMGGIILTLTWCYHVLMNTIVSHFTFTIFGSCRL